MTVTWRRLPTPMRATGAIWCSGLLDQRRQRKDKAERRDADRGEQGGEGQQAPGGQRSEGSNQETSESTQTQQRSGPRHRFRHRRSTSVKPGNAANHSHHRGRMIRAGGRSRPRSSGAEGRPG